MQLCALFHSLAGRNVFWRGIGPFEGGIELEKVRVSYIIILSYVIIL